MEKVKKLSAVSKKIETINVNELENTEKKEEDYIELAEERMKHLAVKKKELLEAVKEKNNDIGNESQFEVGIEMKDADPRRLRYVFGSLEELNKQEDKSRHGEVAWAGNKSSNSLLKLLESKYFKYTLAAVVVGGGTILIIRTFSK